MGRSSRNKLTKDEAEDFDSWSRDRELHTTSKIFMNGIDIKCRSKAQKDALNAMENHDISIITGPPGTGKTYLSCARALKYLKEDPGTYKKIILIKRLPEKFYFISSIIYKYKYKDLFKYFKNNLE
jgi:phosphate starvation-inducible protein PhoH